MSKKSFDFFPPFRCCEQVYTNLEMVPPAVNAWQKEINKKKVIKNSKTNNSSKWQKVFPEPKNTLKKHVYLPTY